jgi:hypothetical protein
MLVTGSLIAVPAHAQDVPDVQDAGPIIDQVLEAYGGSDRLAEVAGYRLEGELQAVRRPAPVRTVRQFARPGRLRVQLDYPEAPETRMLDGMRGWRDRGTGPQTVNGMLLTAMILQAARADLPWILDAHRNVVRVVGPVVRGDRSLVGLEIQMGTSMLFRAYVDTDTHYVVESLGILMAGGQQVRFETRYADFRSVDGIVFPFAEENYASGTHTGSTRITSVDVNPDVAPGTFQPQE